MCRSKAILSEYIRIIKLQRISYKFNLYGFCIVIGERLPNTPSHPIIFVFFAKHAINVIIPSISNISSVLNIECQCYNPNINKVDLKM